ncbi:hypothetical protein [Dactylosporangium salmoneum]|uniref:FtsK domain-containing protein n=1 Tax=Dactylosporangium salmoneum TaxID=53361 RepID=A0ABN3G9P2_9ACTN
MAKTDHRPASLPTVQAGGGFGAASSGQGKVPPPAGAARMQSWFIDPGTGIRQRMPHPVPVNDDNEPTGHVRHLCPKKINANGGGTTACDTAAWLLPGETAPFCPKHGEKLQPPAERGQSAIVAKAAVERYGASLWPWTLPAAGGVADVALSLADTGVSTLAAAPVLAAGAFFVTKRTLTRRAVKRGRIEKGQRSGRRVWEIRRKAVDAAQYGAEAGLWATAFAATDAMALPGLLVWAAAMARWAIGCKRWWDAAEARRLRGVPAPVAVAQPEVEVAAAPDPVQLRAESTWATIIGCNGGPLAGTKLADFRRLPNCPIRASERTVLPNWTATVVAANPGTINMREQRPLLLGRIAAAYGCTYADVSFTADESDLGVAYLRVQPDNLLAEVKMWQGAGASDWKKGVSRIGRHDDGADIRYTWWTSTGAAHDLISGCTGSGKSELVAQLLLTSLHSDGLVLDWVGDPQGGQSYGLLKDAVDWFARDKTEITLMLLAALKEMLRRNDELAKNNIKTWRPTKDMPLLAITLDEVQSYIDDPVILDLVEKLVGQGRKCGIKMRLITQVPAAYNLGGSTYIKEQLKAGQTLIFRAMTDIAGRSAVEGDCPIDPVQLPARWGKHTCNAGETTAGLMFVQGLNARDVYGRSDYTGDDMAVWLADPTPGVFGPEAQLESGVLWGDRRERVKRLLAAGRADEDLLPGGKAVELIQAAAVAAATGTVVRLSQPAPEMPGTSRDVVLQAAQAAAGSDGVVTKKAIEQATKDMPDGTRNGALTDLVAAGKLRRIRNGVYEVPGGGRQEAPTASGAESAV